MSSSPVPPLRVSAADVGRRVVVRHRLPDGRATDALGDLLALDAGHLVVRGADGAVVRVRRADVVAARPVPPRAQRVPRRPAPPSTTPSTTPPAPEDVLALEAVAAAGWPAVEVAHLGGWLLRASSGFTGRANSALPLGDPGVPLPAAVDAVEAFCGARGLLPRASVVEALDGPLDGPVDSAALDALLAARGWSVETPAVVMTAPLGSLAPAPPPQGGLSVDVAADPDEDWLGAYRYRGQPAPPAARAVLTGPPVRAFASVRAWRDDGPRTVAVARGTVTAGAGAGGAAAARGRAWAGITAVEVDPGWRRRGLARALLGALAGWAAERGATDVHLQVALDNAAARALYASAGFTDHHRYHYRVLV